MADVTKNEKKPFNNNNIQNQRPGVERSENLLTGWFANSCNGGHNKAIYFKKIMAGERIREFVIEGKFKMLTPISPSYQKLNMTISSYFVPDSRVWKNAEKYIAQRGGSTEEKIEEIPNTGGKTYGKVLSNDSSNTMTLACNTTAWRDSFISSYIPKIGRSERVSANYPLFDQLPKYSILPLRGRVAIYNDFERMKAYDEEMPEYVEDDIVSDAEWKSYNPFIEKTLEEYNNLSDYYTMRATVPNSYYSDYRTEMQGEEIALSEAYDANEDEQLLRWASIESKINELRQEAENENKNTWDILAEIRGSKKLTEGKVQLLSKKTVTLNYSTVTQNTYNVNEDVQEQYRTMGQQGAYSYTEIKNLPLFAGIEFKEEGWIHIIINVWADTVYEKAWERTMLNVTPFSEFRPDLKDDKLDVLYECESGMPFVYTNASNNGVYYIATGFKRLYSEYFKMGNYCGGDMVSEPYYQSYYNGEMTTLNQTLTNFNTVETQRTHQFFRSEAEYIETGIEKGMPIAYTKIWKDYTDILINRNQAILNDTTAYQVGGDQYKNPEIQGQNQIFFIGKCYCRTELPIPEEIKNNFTKYGEH